MYFGPSDTAIDGVSMPTIRVGSTGPAVTTWQKVIGVTADGQFGPNTLAATKTWQSAHGLVADGVVGPLTWGASGAGGSIGKTALIVGGVAATAGAGWWWWKRRKGHH